MSEPPAVPHDEVEFHTAASTIDRWNAIRATLLAEGIVPR